MSSPVRARIVVTGRVQGVWFRASTRDRARGLGLRGFVRNRRDGSVEIEAEGPAAAVESLVAWCRVGPPAARVSHLAREDIDPAGGEPGFELRPTV